MLLYDVFGKGKDFDANVALPAKGKKGDRAVCKNGPKEVLIWNGKKWVSEAAASLGARGGSMSSPKKAAAARENGRKGGRPPLDPLTKTVRGSAYRVRDGYEYAYNGFTADQWESIGRQDIGDILRKLR